MSSRLAIFNCSKSNEKLKFRLENTFSKSGRVQYNELHAAAGYRYRLRMHMRSCERRGYIDIYSYSIICITNPAADNAQLQDRYRASEA